MDRLDTWDSKQDAFDFHRKKRVFQKISDEVLWDYIECGTEIDANKKYTLTYSKEWEVHCYTLLPNLWPVIDKCSVPVLGIRGGESDVLLPSAWQRWKRKTPQHRLVEIPETSHLLPFENPKAVTDLILKLTTN